MELLHMGQDAVPMMLPLLPMGTQVGATAKPAPLKTNSLSRLEDLQQHLRRCDDPAYLNRYVKLLSSMPRTVLAELTRKVKARSAWLSAEEQREYKRAKVLNVMGAPCYAPGSGEHDHGCPVGGAASADADAFCSQVLGGSGGSGADWGADADRAGAAAVAAAFAASDMKLERLDMSQEQQPFATPADAARTKLASLASRQPASGSEPASASAGACAADTPWTGVSLPSGLATGDGGVVADHQISRISPDYQPALAGLEAAAAGAGAKHSGRVRQATLSACDT